MIRAALSLAALSLSLAAPAQAAEQNATFHQTCMMQAELAHDLLGVDARTKDAPQRASAEASLKAFASAHEAMMGERLEAGYEQAAAFGWDKAKVDAQHTQMGAAMKAKLDPILAGGTLYTDVVFALNTCTQGAPDTLGQAQDAFKATLEQLLKWTTS